MFDFVYVKKENGTRLPDGPVNNIIYLVAEPINASETKVIAANSEIAEGEFLKIIPANDLKKFPE